MNNFDIGMQQDFDNMTDELGRTVFIYERDDILSDEGQEGDNDRIAGASALKRSTTETVFLQEMDSEHEMLASGQMDVGDVRFVFKADTTIKEEDYVSPDEKIMYKVLKLTKVKGMNNNVVVYVKGFGKKVPNR